MLIKKQDLDIVNDFVDNNESKDSTYTFPHIDKQLSDFLKEPAEFLVRDYHKDYHASIRTERLTLTIFEQDEFVWKLHLKNSTLQGFMDSQHLVNLLVDYKIAITKIYTNIIPEVKRLIEFDALLRNADWGLHNLNKFYAHFAIKGEDLETDDCMKELNKAKFEDWDKGLFYKSHDGKRASIDYYRRVFDNFATCLERIKNLQLNDIPA